MRSGRRSDRRYLHTNNNAVNHTQHHMQHHLPHEITIADTTQYVRSQWATIYSSHSSVMVLALYTCNEYFVYFDTVVDLFVTNCLLHVVLM